ncbi:MAG: hypothetical protein ACK56I_25980, partial [bacterium]
MAQRGGVSRELDVIPVAGARIHLHLPVGPCLGRQFEGELPFGSGVSQLHGSLPIGTHHPHSRVLCREACGTP